MVGDCIYTSNLIVMLSLPILALHKCKLNIKVNNTLTSALIYTIFVQMALSLQRFFGNIRSFGGHEDHPTIVNFSYIFRLLTIYAPMKAAIKGNVEAQEDILPVLSGVLEAGVKDNECHKEKLHARLEKKLEELCFDLQDTSTMAALPSTSKDHPYSKATAEDCVVYYLAGYIVHKISKKKGCLNCLADIQTDAPHMPAAWVTFARSFKEMSLKHPTEKMFLSLRSIESTVSSALNRFQLCSDIFWELLDALELTKFPKLGCAEHKDNFTATVLRTYTMLRMHFFARDMSKKLSKSVETAHARKRAKLM